MLIDGFQCGMFDRAAFEGLLRGGVSCVNVTCGYWEDAIESLDNLALWRDLVRANADLALIATRVADIEHAHASGRVALLLGYQSINCLQGRIRFVELLADLGVRAIQLTYNNQSEAGGSCYETHDGGLTRFGRELVPELNRCGMLIDISHVGERTARDVIERSERPVSATHANAASLIPHPRNKSDDVLKALAAAGGVLGCATYPNLLGDRYGKSLEAWCEMVARTVEIMGVEHVAIGSGRRYRATQADLDWVRMGRWTRKVDFGAASTAKGEPNPVPSWCRELEDYRRFADGLRGAGFSSSEIEAIIAGNWMRLFTAIFPLENAGSGAAGGGRVAG
jgi:microsomal dipeptidase-like Zn-dependent dipeptidase